MTSLLLYSTFEVNTLLKVNTVSKDFGVINMSKNLISVKEIVKKYSIPYSTVNHYSIIGLLTVADRRKNMRLYDEAQVKERLATIARLRGKGYPLHLIQNELNKT